MYMCLSVLSSLSLLTQHGLPCLGDGAAYSGLGLSTTINIIKTVPHRHELQDSTQMILDWVKLTTKISCYNLLKIPLLLRPKTKLSIQRTLRMLGGGTFWSCETLASGVGQHDYKRARGGCVILFCLLHLSVHKKPFPDTSTLVLAFPPSKL